MREKGPGSHPFLQICHVTLFQHSSFILHPSSFVFPSLPPSDTIGVEECFPPLAEYPEMDKEWIDRAEAIQRRILQLRDSL